MKNGTGNPPVPPRARFRGVSARFGRSGQYENSGRYVILSKKKKKEGPNDAVLDLSKYLAQTLFFHSFTLTFTLKSSLPSSSSHCRRPHCRCSAVSQSHSVSLNSQGILSLLSLSRIQPSVQLQPNFFFFPYDLLCG